MTHSNRRAIGAGLVLLVAAAALVTPTLYVDGDQEPAAGQDVAAEREVHYGTLEDELQAPQEAGIEVQIV